MFYDKQKIFFYLDNYTLLTIHYSLIKEGESHAKNRQT